jgi:hypothetical protein
MKSASFYFSIEAVTVIRIRAAYGLSLKTSEIASLPELYVSIYFQERGLWESPWWNPG